jgi:hypothetical protein
MTDNQELCQIERDCPIRGADHDESAGWERRGPPHEIMNNWRRNWRRTQKTKKPRQVKYAMRLSVHSETRFELAFPSTPKAFHTRGLAAASPHVGNVLRALNSLKFGRFAVCRGA